MTRTLPNKNVGITKKFGTYIFTKLFGTGHQVVCDCHQFTFAVCPPYAVGDGLPATTDFVIRDPKKSAKVKGHNAVLLSRPWRTFTVTGTCGLRATV